jgi:chromosomal replication initiation ATPase DnaA
MYLGRQYTGVSLREIADRLEARDISTVSHGEKRVAKGLGESEAGAKELKRAPNKVYSVYQA